MKASPVQTGSYAYLENTDEKERNHTRKSHMNHSEGYRIWKIEVLCRENPLQMNKKQSNIHYSIFKTETRQNKKS